MPTEPSTKPTTSDTTWIGVPMARSVEATMAHYGWTRTFVFERLAAGELQGVKAGRRTTITSASAQRLFERLPRARYRNASAGMAV